MQRQRSILTFFQKPLTGSQSSATAEVIDSCKPSQVMEKLYDRGDAVSKPSLASIALESSSGVARIDTPPEKEPCKILPAGFKGSNENGGPFLFSTIMHKFNKAHDQEKVKERVVEQALSSDVPSFSKLTGVKELTKQGVTYNGVKDLSKQGEQFQHLERDTIFNFNGAKDQDDVLGPETPGMRPRHLHLKRVQEDIPVLGDKMGRGLLDSSKRQKLFQNQIGGNKSNVKETDTVSKFEWLDPSRIKDAKGRKPDHPLYDKKTLYIPPDALKKMSASQKQYWTIKCQYMDVLLFFKVGKFYELYEVDAEIGHKELDWKMTISGVGKCRQVGISESGIDDAVQKLVARGYKVGRIEQLETSDQAKLRGSNAVISRKLVHVMTPSTTNDSNIGIDAVHLLAIKEETNGVETGSKAYGFAFVDCAALRFWVGSITDDASCAALGALLMQVSPKEVIYDSIGLSREAQKALRKYTLVGTTAVQLTPAPPVAEFIHASEIKHMIQTKEYFVKSSNSWDTALDGVIHHDLAVCALGGLIGHLSRLMLDDVLQNGYISPYQVYEGCLRIDGQTMVNLEIFSNSADGGPSGTLYKYLDNCVTPSGKRLLRSWICHPLKNVDCINNRLNAVEGLMAHPEIIQLIYQYLRRLPDLERLLGRVRATTQSSATLLLPMIGKKVSQQRVKAFGSFIKGLRSGLDLIMLLQKEGNLMLLLSKVFKIPMLSGGDGLDEFLTQFEAAIDSDFPNYQKHEMTAENAELLSILIELLIEKATQWSEVIHAINCIDVLRSFTVTSTLSPGTMARPVILPESRINTFNQDITGPILQIKGLWHPFALGDNGDLPVPNDVHLGKNTDGHNSRSLLLTGPNMGGKSTLLRATCLAVLMAQLGCYVPCETCALSLVDVIFTRLGATDRIMTGESTFLIECTETASVLQNATQDSLVLLDELGRGTSTFDGYAIAYAVFRHLVEKVNCRLLFATHYHSLTKEFGSHPHVKLQHMACAFKSKSRNSSLADQDLIFLYRLMDGACPESYGLQVARMAGIPEQVVKTATNAGQVMKESIGGRFKSSEQRSEFSTLHEEWLKALVSISRISNTNLVDDDDSYDTLFCLWHEIRCSYRLQK